MFGSTIPRSVEHWNRIREELEEVDASLIRFEEDLEEVDLSGTEFLGDLLEGFELEEYSGEEEVFEELAPGFLRDPKPGDVLEEVRDIFLQDPTPGEKIRDNWHSIFYEPEEYEPYEYVHAVFA